MNNSNSEKTKPTDTDDSPEEPIDGVTPDDGPASGRATAGRSEEDGEATSEDIPELSTEEQLAEMTDRWMRSRADTENIRRRARLDVEDARKHGASGLILSLLPVLDSLQRALATKPDAASDAVGATDKVWEGLELTEQMLMGTLAAHGVTPIDAQPGAPFDPTAHQALLEQPTSEQEPGTIVMELVRGYRLHDRLLREAQVTVAARPAGSGGEGPAGVPGKDLPDADV